MRGEMAADLVLEADLLVEAHAAPHRDWRIGSNQSAHIDLAGDGGGDQGAAALLKKANGGFRLS